MKSRSRRCRMGCRGAPSSRPGHDRRAGLDRPRTRPRSRAWPRPGRCRRQSPWAPGSRWSARSSSVGILRRRRGLRADDDGHGRGHVHMVRPQAFRRRSSSFQVRHVWRPPPPVAHIWRPYVFNGTKYAPEPFFNAERQAGRRCARRRAPTALSGTLPLHPPTHTAGGAGFKLRGRPPSKPAGHDLRTGLFDPNGPDRYAIR